MWTAFLKFACGPTDKPSPNGRDFGILLVRLYAGGLMIWLHGWSKAQKIGAETIAFPDPLGIGAELSLYLAVFAEVVCAALLVVGLFTRFACLPLLVTMLVAFFIVHADDPLKVREPALLYLLPYLALLFSGAGRYSFDRIFREKFYL